MNWFEVYMGDLVGDQVYGKLWQRIPCSYEVARYYPIPVVQVHPDDTLAHKRHKTQGKSEMWYIMKRKKMPN